MRNTTIALLSGLAVLTTPLAAQTKYNARVIQAMAPAGGKYVAPICPLKGGDFRTSSAGLYLKVAIEGFKDASVGQSTVSEKSYNEGLKKAIAASLGAIEVNSANAAGWYFLGRASLQLGDLQGADSALTRLEALSPDCNIEIKGMRQKAWLVLVNPSADFLSKKMFDSALAVLRDANTIARYYPQGFYNLGATFANVSPAQPDSAIYYFKIAVEKAGTDPTLVETLKPAIFNLGFLYSAKGDQVAAIAEYRKYLAIDPASESVKRSLATSLRLAGATAEAVQIENQLMAAGKLSGGEIAAVGVRLFNEKDYAGASEAFKKVLVIDPNNHDALFNLANTYLALNDGKSLITTAQKLLDTDPLNTLNVKLLANGWRLENNIDKQVDVVTLLQSMTTNISVEHFTVAKDGATLTGTATGIEGRTNSDKVIPPAAMTVVFEFTDAAGAVVATAKVSIPALAPNAKQDIAVDVTGAAIMGWKYRKK